MNEARVPAGVPTGGQFTEQPKGETDVELRTKGSFLYPPPLGTAEEVISYYTHLDIPDQALARTARLYEARKLDENREKLLAVSWSWGPRRHWVQANPPPDAPEGSPEMTDWEAREADAQQAHIEQLRPIMMATPDKLERSDVRPMFQAVAMLRATRGLEPDEEAKVYTHRIRFSDGERTVEEATINTAIAPFCDQIADPDQYDADQDGIIDTDHATIRQIVNEALRRQTEEIKDEFGVIRDNQVVLGDTVIAGVEETAGKRGFFR